jgi:hypothetical protein
MSLRHVVGVAAIATAAVLVPALPGGAAPSVGACKPYPPSAGEKLTIDASPRTITAGQQTLVFGAFTQGGCPIHGARIAVQRKRLVSGAVKGSWHTIATVTTTSHGTYATSTSPSHNERLRAHFAPPSGSAFTVRNSNGVNVHVRTHVTESIAKRSSCRLTISGATSPVKAGRRIYIQRKTSTGQKTVATAVTTTRGHYSKTKTFTCGHTYKLSAFIKGDSTNSSGRSPIVRVKPTQ